MRQPTIFATREEWIRSEAQAHAAYLKVHSHDPERRFVSVDDGVAVLDAHMPFKAAGYPWKSLNGLALVAKLEFKDEGPTPQAVDLCAKALNSKGQLCTLLIERGDSRGTLAFTGGFIDPVFVRKDETPESAIRREVWEEIELALPDLSGPYALTLEEKRLVDGVARTRSDSSCFTVLLPCVPDVKPTGEAPKIFLVPDTTLATWIANRQITMHADHGVMWVSVTLRLGARMGSLPRPPQDRYLRTAYDELEGLAPTLRSLKRDLVAYQPKDDPDRSCTVTDSAISRLLVDARIGVQTDPGPVASRAF